MSSNLRLTVATVLSMILCTVGSFAQNNHKGGQDWQEKIRSEKIAFLTSEMDLTPAEAEKFWPEYNEVQKDRNAKMEELFKNYRALVGSLKSNKSESEYDALLQAYLKAEAETHTHEKEYVERFRKILPAEKVVKLYVAEEKFRRDQIHRLRRNSPQRSSSEGK